MIKMSTQTKRNIEHDIFFSFRNKINCVLEFVKHRWDFTVEFKPPTVVVLFSILQIKLVIL